MEVNSLRDRLSSGAFSSWTSHTHAPACTYAPESGCRSHHSCLFCTYHCRFSSGLFLGTERSHGAVRAPIVVAVGEMMFSKTHTKLCFSSHIQRHTEPPPHQLRVWKRGREGERGSKLVSGMDSLKWIVLGDIALTFVQSAVLRDLPVCFNSSELARFSLAVEGILAKIYSLHLSECFILGEAFNLRTLLSASSTMDNIRSKKWHAIFVVSMIFLAVSQHQGVWTFAEADTQ